MNPVEGNLELWLLAEAKAGDQGEAAQLYVESLRERGDLRPLCLPAKAKVTSLTDWTD